MGRRRTNYIHADSETDPNNNNNISTAFLTAQRKSNVEHKKLHRLIAGSKRAFLFFNIYSCLHSILLLTLFANQVSLWLGKKTLPSIMILLLRSRKVWERDPENMASSHTKHMTEMRAPFTTTQLHCFTNFLFFHDLTSQEQLCIKIDLDAIVIHRVVALA